MVDLAELLGRLRHGRVDHVQQKSRPLEMCEELVPEPDALARPFDQAGDVGDRQLPAVGRFHGPEHRLESRERIIGDLRLRVRDPPEQRRLTRVRQPDQGRVRKQLQPQFELRLLPGEPGLREPRCLARRRREVAIPAPAASAARDNHPRAGRREVGDDLVLGEDLRPDRDLQLDVRAVGAMLPAPPPRLAAPALEHALRAERGEVAQVGVGDQQDVAAAAAVAAVRPTLGDELLPAEREPAVAPAPGLHRDAGPIVEHRAA